MTQQVILCREQTVHQGAVFSADNKHRFYLWRNWSNGGGFRKGIAVFVLANPSWDDELVSSNSVTFCERWAYRHDYLGMRVVNLFSCITSKPEEAEADLNSPEHEQNKAAIKKALEGAEIVVCGWGEETLYEETGIWRNRVKSQGGGKADF